MRLTRVGVHDELRLARLERQKQQGKSVFEPYQKPGHDEGNLCVTLDLEGRPFGAVEEARVRGLGSPRHPTSRPYGTGSDHSVALVYRRLETHWWAVRGAQDAF